MNASSGTTKKTTTLPFENFHGFPFGVRPLGCLVTPNQPKTRRARHGTWRSLPIPNALSIGLFCLQNWGNFWWVNVGKCRYNTPTPLSIWAFPVQRPGHLNEKNCAMMVPSPNEESPRPWGEKNHGTLLPRRITGPSNGFGWMNPYVSQWCLGPQNDASFEGVYGYLGKRIYQILEDQWNKSLILVNPRLIHGIVKSRWMFWSAILV